MIKKKTTSIKKLLYALVYQQRQEREKRDRFLLPFFGVKSALRFICRPKEELYRKKIRNIVRQENLFDPEFYLRNNPDLVIGCVDLCRHFFDHGWKEGRDPSSVFDVTFYLKENTDVKESGLNPLEHYVLFGRFEQRARNQIEHEVSLIRSAGLFDEEWYFSEYPELKKFNIEPSWHFCKYGWKEGKMANPFFETNWYLQQMERQGDILQEEDTKEFLPKNPVVHWLKEGKARNWPTNSGSRDYMEFLLPRLRRSDICRLISDSGLFDEQYYQSQLTAPVPSPLNHYIAIGYCNGTAPNPLFDDDFYLSQMPLLKSYDVPPLIHYILHGSRFGVKPHPCFDPAFYRKYYSGIADIMDPLFHFLTYGWQEWRRPSADFYIAEHVQTRFSSPPERDQFFSSLACYQAPEKNAVAYDNYQLWYERERPEVSIVLLNWNKTFLTEDCLLSLWKHTAGHRYEIIIVDNGSERSEQEKLLQFAEGVTVIPLKLNRYYGEGNNIGVEQAKGEYLVILNNDTIATENWLQPLIAELKSNEAAGAVGSKLLFPNSLIQECGVRITPEGEVTQLKKNQLEDNEKDICEVDYCSAAALAMRKDVFLQILGFDYTWEPAYYEDSDLCMKIRAMGKKIFNVPESRIIHLEHISVSNQDSLDFSQIIDVNKRKFQQRWGDFLAGGSVPQVAVRAERSSVFFASGVQEKKAVVYTPYPLLLGGGERYLLTIIEELLTDYQVWLVGEEKYSTLRVHTLADDLGLCLPGIKVLSERELLERQLDADLSVVMGNEILPRIPAMARKNIFHCQFPFMYYFSEHGISSQMLQNYIGYDRIMVNSEFTRQNILKQQQHYHLKNIEVTVVHPPVGEMNINLSSISPSEKHKILSIGRFFVGGHNKKHDFMIAAFQQLVEKYDQDVELHLVGGTHSERIHKKYLEKLMRMAEGYPVFFHLDACTATLERLLREATIYWHATGIDVDPCRYPEAMEHFGISVVEAMKNGCIPFVPGKGGVVEIVRGCSERRLCYRDSAELVEFTLGLLAATPEEFCSLRDDVVARAASYGNAIFKKKTREMIDSICM